MLLLEWIVLTLLAVPAVVSSVYLLILTLLSAPNVRPARSSRRLQFDVVVPAHNEASGIEATVRSLAAMDWDKDKLRIHVVADNCTDNTAQLAADAGAHVWERQHAELRGKGYALAYAFEKCLTEGWSDAIVVVDADSSVSSNLLEAFAARIEGGEQAIQAHYGIRNPMNSWRTQLVTIAMGAFHIVRSRARDRLGLSTGIRGNGWCVTTKGALKAVPYQAFSLTEDLEYGVRLGLAGIRVAYADEASANGDMVSSAKVAGKQRQRWESGRFEMIRKFALSTLVSAFRRLDAVQLDLALDLLVLPLSYVVINTVVLVLGGLAAGWLGQPELLIFAWLGLFCLAALVLHIGRGWWLSGTGSRGLIALGYAPFYIVWKLVVMLGDKSKEWIRTERETQ